LVGGNITPVAINATAGGNIALVAISATAGGNITSVDLSDTCFSVVSRFYACMHVLVIATAIYLHAGIFSYAGLCISADYISYICLTKLIRTIRYTVTLTCIQLTFNFEGKLAIVALLIYISCMCGHVSPCSVVPEQCMHSAKYYRCNRIFMNLLKISN